MSRPRQLHQAKTSLEMIEEAIDLLRRAPLGAFAAYYLGTLPFVLAGLYFWADMSASPFADQHLAGAALTLALLFLWMKFWQALFGRVLRLLLTENGGTALSVRQCGRIFSAQSLVQPLGLFLAPLALISLFGFPWVYAFFQNLSVLDGGESPQVGDLVKRSLKQTRLSFGQNYVLIIQLFGFGLIVWMNWATVCLALPALVKMLLGLESVFTRSTLSLLNTTFFAVVFGLAYLSVDPIVKGVYALRCFYGESMKTGQDLKAELGRIRKSLEPGALAAMLILLLMLGNPAPVSAQSSPPAAVAKTNSTVPPAELDRAITQVMQQRKFAWRMPRQKVVESESDDQGFFGRLFARVGKFLRDILKTVGEWMENVLRKLLGERRHTTQGSSGYGWIFLEELLLYGLLAAAVIGLAFLFLRTWNASRNPKLILTSEPIQSAPDLSDQNVGAEQLPEDGWSKLARELLARGELRLALRAFYFASLANLSQRNLIQLARFKSNRDYERELRRRGHAFPDLLVVFSENVSVFDRIWYGMQEISADLVNRFAANVEKLRGAS